MPAPRPVAPWRSARRRAHPILVLGALAILVSSLGIAAATSPASAERFGEGPLDSIRQGAQAQSKCAGLTSNELAAMMVVPTYGEAGGPVPPPMALSRWDNLSVSSSNARLFAFGQTNGRYVNAFFSPGIGLWQFDSAGGWDLTASDAIDTRAAARQAAATMAFRYCNPPSSVARDDASLRRYAWGPWFACSVGTSCEARYASVIQGDQLRLDVDRSVDRYGGMEQRTCDVAGMGNGITCWYVDPARAQGATGWRGGTYDPNRSNYVTPLPKPFYVVRWGDREHRFWLPADTGYDIGITAHKRVVRNARGAGELVWERSAPLCDRTHDRGTCGSQPAGVHAPFGVLDGASPAGPLAVRVQGWAIDRDTTDPIQVHVYVGGKGTAILANRSRADVAAAHPGTGTNRGYDAVVPATDIGPQEVCAYGIDTGGGPGNRLLGCTTVNVTGHPRGAIDAAVGFPAAVLVEGWVSVPGDPTAPAVVSLDGRRVATIRKDVRRADVQAGVPGAGSHDGFRAFVPADGGTRRVCLSAGEAHREALGCRTVSVPTGPPFGVLDSVRPVPNGIDVAGWSIDPDVNGPIDVHVYVGSSGTALRADRSRGDVGAAHPLYGPHHGFRGRLAAPPGTHDVCAYGINVKGGANSSLGCRRVTVPAGAPVRQPFGVVDHVTRTPDGVRVAGWAIDPDTVEPISVHVYVGSSGYALLADRRRGDVAAAFPGSGDRHGYSAVLPAGPEQVTVCAYAINVGAPTDNRLLGCRNV